ncbi:MAG: autophagy protein 17 [Candelina mexicana]|nr:MAG: autophagy protein 17 [Candelina mexicana]
MSASCSDTNLSKEQSENRESHALGDATQKTLVSHLLASKRSLSSVSLVWRANELVTSARALLEERVVLGARTDFVRKGVEEQVKILQSVRNGVEGVAREGQAEFKKVLRDLDTADARLKRTMKELRSTIVEPSLRGPGEDRKSLLDFVDEESVDGIMGSLRDSIDKTNEARITLHDSNKTFDDDLESITVALSKSSKEGLFPSSEFQFDSPIGPLMRSLEIHAKEMADLLESLVRHFDLCVTAVKHTEGGGATAQKITGDIPEGVDANLDDVDAALEPMTEEEMVEMLKVLERDAADVDDVATEIHDRLVEMESQFEHIIFRSDCLARRYANTTAAFSLTEEVGEKLLEYVSQGRQFLMRWNEERQVIEEGLEETERLGDFYERFLMAYDGLIIEVGRRKSAQVKMEKVKEEAMEKLEQLHENELAEREHFRLDQGEYLPSDIWPGLVDSPMRYRMVPTEENTRVVPPLPRSVLEAALRRTNGRL